MIFDINLNAGLDFDECSCAHTKDELYNIRIYNYDIVILSIIFNFVPFQQYANPRELYIFTSTKFTLPKILPNTLKILYKKYQKRSINMIITIPFLTN